MTEIIGWTDSRVRCAAIGTRNSMGAAWSFEAFAVIVKEEGEGENGGGEDVNDHEGVKIGEQTSLLGEKRAEPGLGVLCGVRSKSAIMEAVCEAVEPSLEIAVGRCELGAEHILMELLATRDDGGHHGNSNASAK